MFPFLFVQTTFVKPLLGKAFSLKGGNIDRNIDRNIEQNVDRY